MMLDGAPQVLISEFLAVNRDGLRDEDGDASDWIEIHNPTAATINLEGWHLSDNDDRLEKWTFPSVDIPPGGFLVVFASNKDRADVGAPLHTNFQLSSGGDGIFDPLDIVAALTDGRYSPGPAAADSVFAALSGE